MRGNDSLKFWNRFISSFLMCHSRTGDSKLPRGSAQRQLHPAQDPAQQGGPTGVPHDGGEGAGLHL